MTAYLAAALVLVFPALVIVAALRDAASYTIPNSISLALLAAFPPAALALGLPLPAIGLHAAIGLVALLAGMAMFAMNWIGGGDAKLFAAAALWLGFPAVASFLLGTCVAGGLLALLLLTLRSARVRPLVTAGPGWLVRLAEPGESVPYGLAICAGALAAFPASPLIGAFRAFA
ncbi:prepilin peptidase [Phenylobacterium sp.]|uniref:A24 family peptidase n=1 Tax=Phenylobacterium sp. TaxID=1871053 RepID=UPI0035AE02AC